MADREAVLKATETLEQTVERLDSFVTAVAGKRLTYKELTA